MKIPGGYSWLLASAGLLVGFCLVVWNVEEVTEFSPDALLFRQTLHVGNVRIVAFYTWSTPLLDEARRKNPMPKADGPIRWTYVYGINLFGRRRVANGDAKPAYRLFRVGMWDDVLSDPNNNRDEILQKCVTLMRDLKYGDAAEFLFDKRFGVR